MNTKDQVIASSLAIVGAVCFYFAGATATTHHKYSDRINPPASVVDARQQGLHCWPEVHFDKQDGYWWAEWLCHY